MLAGFARNWWLIALRGMLAMAFGGLALVWPAIALGALVLVFGAYALIDGIVAAVAAIRAAPPRGVRWPLLFEGVVGIGAGALTVTWPEITALVLVYLIAAWAILTGVFELAAAVELRRDAPDEWLLAIGGVLSIAFGVLLAAFPEVGQIVIALLVGTYALVFGAALLILSVSVRARARRSLLVA